MPKVFDVFTFNDELDVLETRLHELGDHVDVFLAVEGNRTHQGAYRETVLERHMDRFRHYGRKLVTMVAPLFEHAPPGIASVFPNDPHWNRFLCQQEAGLDALRDASDGDVVLFGDVDEIPRREMALLRPGENEVVALGMRHHVYGLNWLYPEQWVGTGVARLGTARRKGLHRIRCGRPGATVVNDAGWHLSWFGGAAACRAKIDSFTHPELAPLKPALEWAIRHGIAYDGRKLWPVRFDPEHPEDFPRYVAGGDMKAHWDPK